MAQNLYLVTKTLEPGQNYINGCTAVLINADSADSDADRIQEAVDVANKSELFAASNGSGVGNVEIGGLEDVYPAKYFDTCTLVCVSAAGPLESDTDAYVFRAWGPVLISAPE